MNRFALACATALAVTAVATTGSAQTATRSAGIAYFGSIQHSPAKIELAVKNLRECLRVGNRGVIESALGHIAHLKIAGAQADLRCLRPEIDRLTLTGSTPSVRTRAYLTGLLMDSPALFASPDIRNAEDGEELFQALGSALQRSLIGYGEVTYVYAE